MSSYMVGHTNYFRVTDENRYKELCRGLACRSDDIHHATRAIDGADRHMFGAYGHIQYNPDGNMYEELDDMFFPELQKILPDGEAFVIMENGNKNLQGLVCKAVVVTKNGIEHIDMNDCIMKTVWNMVGNSNYKVNLNY